MCLTWRVVCRGIWHMTLVEQAHADRHQRLFETTETAWSLHPTQVGIRPNTAVQLSRQARTQPEQDSRETHAVFDHSAGQQNGSGCRGFVLLGSRTSVAPFSSGCVDWLGTARLAPVRRSA